MIRRRLLGAAVLLALVATAFAAITPSGRSDDDSGRHQIAMLDDCDPRDPLWNNVGGCALKRGDVSFLEFVGEADSPLAAAVIGHQAWRNSPSYLEVTVGRTIRVKNEGGREHTFTKVANFGGGVVPTLNEGLQTAPECLEFENVEPGDTTTLPSLAVGNHRFMCCFHPWMRALIKVKAHGEGGFLGG